jgi:hypothetical protein
MYQEKFSMGLEMFSLVGRDISWVVDKNGVEMFRGTYSACREYLREFGARIIS